MADEKDRDIASPTHQRAPFSDPLADGADPTSPGAPHEPGGTDYHQSDEVSTATPMTERPRRNEGGPTNDEVDPTLPPAA